MAKPPEFVIDRNTVYRVTIGTDRGRIVMDLDPRLAPNAVNKKPVTRDAAMNW